MIINDDEKSRSDVTRGTEVKFVYTNTGKCERFFCRFVFFYERYWFSLVDQSKVESIYEGKKGTEDQTKPLSTPQQARRVRER
jgi:hypothetical protein